MVEEYVELSTVMVCATLVLSEPSICGKWLICSGLFLSTSFTCTLSLYAVYTDSTQLHYILQCVLKNRTAMN